MSVGGCPGVRGGVLTCHGIHDTMILGKYMSRGRVSWVREPGLHFKNQFSEGNWDDFSG